MFWLYVNTLLSPDSANIIYSTLFELLICEQVVNWWRTFAAGGCHTLFLEEETLLLMSQRFYSRQEAALVACGRRL